MLKSHGVQLIAIALTALIIDMVFDVPSPPGWLVSWTAWSVAAFALLSGPRIVRQLTLRGKDSN